MNSSENTHMKSRVVAIAFTWLCVVGMSTAVAGQPSNDVCANATGIVGIPFTDSAVDWTAATDDMPTICDQFNCPGDSNNGVWWTYTPSADCMATIDITVNGGFQETVLTVLTGTDCNNLAEADCDLGPGSANVFLTGGVQHWFMVSKRDLLDRTEWYD